MWARPIIAPDHPMDTTPSPGKDLVNAGSLVALGLLSSFLSSTRSEGTVPGQSCLGDLVAEVVAAINELAKDDDLPPEVRRLVRDRLEDILWALHKLRFRGPDAARAAAERLAFTVATAPEEARARPSIQKAVAAAGAVWGTVLRPGRPGRHRGMGQDLRGSRPRAGRMTEERRWAPLSRRVGPSISQHGVLVPHRGTLGSGKSASNTSSAMTTRNDGSNSAAQHDSMVVLPEPGTPPRRSTTEPAAAGGAGAGDSARCVAGARSRGPASFRADGRRRKSLYPLRPRRSSSTHRKMAIGRI